MSSPTDALVTMYFLEGGRWGGYKLTEAKVERATRTSVWIGGRRHARSSWRGTYYDTPEAAHADAIQFAEARVDQARQALQAAQDALGSAKGLLKRFVHPHGKDTIR